MVCAGEKGNSARGHFNEAFHPLSFWFIELMKTSFAFLFFFLVLSLRENARNQVLEKNCFHGLKCKPQIGFSNKSFKAWIDKGKHLIY